MGLASEADYPFTSGKKGQTGTCQHCHSIFRHEERLASLPIHFKIETENGCQFWTWSFHFKMPTNTFSFVFLTTFYIPLPPPKIPKGKCSKKMSRNEITTKCHGFSYDFFFFSFSYSWFISFLLGYLRICVLFLVVFMHLNRNELGYKRMWSRLLQWPRRRTFEGQRCCVRCFLNLFFLFVFLIHFFSSRIS